MVTGGSTGIGRALALAYLAEGCKVVVSARTQARLDAFMEECQSKGFSQARAVNMDASTVEGNQLLLEKTLEAFGGLDIWINNAGVSMKRTMLMDVSLTDWDYIMNVNLRGVLIASQVAGNYMKEHGGGVIANSSSFAVRVPTAGSGTYAVSKAGVSTLSQIMAAELAPYNIRVFSFIPGMIETDMTKARLSADRKREESLTAMRRVGTPEEVANVVLMMTSGKAGYLTGTAIEISGGRLCVQNPQVVWNS